MSIYIIFIAQLDEINGNVENCVEDRTNRIMLLQIQEKTAC